ncbi:transporter substrate-binding domain-containing protein [Entomospira culicis]|uniref:Transporter substrate-binding domain-containing protein n=1 Tax=Entomospira culicis TaxID=2719989 RepID=A0A968GGP8_9SPIO|nr:transporter substrate-binding domain-containing protein [Entomospira culicis]NIZ19962.1 transporter substrate-binding domain-containing protein [Entomospira culicis]NIZ70173.1 transporter substrate-binding domain-containing protein [Entomospira culicis]WDI38006.1 transporter substrate-binding domain-containing protein [Entomospira culicis]WDI39629.1 transporter substrate-binding domain-containing protein [Entomospira culicis]
MMKKGLFFSLLFASVIALLSGCDAKKSGESSKPRTKIVVGLEGDYTPYNWTTLREESGLTYPFSGQKGNAAGYDVMIAQRLAQELGMELEIKKISWDGLILALQNNNIDLIIAGMSATPERMRSISFTDPYYHNEDTQEIVLVVRADGAYTQATQRSDFSGAKITAQLGTYHVAILEQLPAIQSSALLTDYVALMQSLKAGVIDGYLAELVVGDEHVRANPDFVMIHLTGDQALEIPASYSASAIGMRKDDDALRQRINAILATIPEEERIAMMQVAKDAASQL